MIEYIGYQNRIRLLLLAFRIVSMFTISVYFNEATAADSKDPKAVKIAEETIQAMGGMDNWKNTSALRFDWVIAREGQEARVDKHLWDRKNNRDHVEWKTQEGKMRVAWVNLTDRSGAAWDDGKKLEGEELKKAMDSAVSRWINDTYWVIAPLKLLDSGVNLKYDGEKNGHDILHLSFNSVGDTPGDQFWVHINKQTRLMDHWDFELQSKNKGSFDWIDWVQVGKMKFSKTKPSIDKKGTIKIDPLEALDSASADYFSQELKMLN